MTFVTYRTSSFYPNYKNLLHGAMGHIVMPSLEIHLFENLTHINSGMIWGCN